MLKGNLKKGVWASSKVSLKSKYRNYVIIIISIEYYKLKNKEKLNFAEAVYIALSGLHIQVAHSTYALIRIGYPYIKLL